MSTLQPSSPITANMTPAEVTEVPFTSLPAYPSAANMTPAEVIEVPFTSLPVHQLAVSLWTVCYPLLLLLGTFGNVMSIVIMRRLMTAQSTVNLFFIAIAGGDLIVLYTGTVMKWVNIAYGLNVTDRWPALYFSCLSSYLGSGGFVSWILVCMTLQRALSVAWPHHVSRLFTRGRTVKVIVGVAVFQVAMYSHPLYCIHVTSTTNITGGQCMRTAPTYAWFLDNVFIYMAMVVNSVLPFACLLTGNGVLIAALVHSVTRVHKTTASGDSQPTHKRQKDANSVTVTIIVVSLTFIAFTLPVFVYADLYQFKDQSRMSGQKRAHVFLFYTFSSLLTSANSAVNFYLYCLTGRRFRQEFVSIVACRAREGTNT